MTGNGSPSLRALGNSDLLVSPIGFGAWALGGGDWQYSLGPQDDKESIAAIHRALDLGINWIDTAPVYGLGHSGDVVARAVKSASRKPYLFSKCSVRWRSDGSLYNSLKAESISEEVENSLKRLGVETIDLYQIHHPLPERDLEEGWATLARFKEQGKIRAIGVSNFTVEQMKRVEKIAPIASVQPPYSLLDRDIECDILPFAQAHGIGVINYSPMAQGLLTGEIDAKVVAAMHQDDFRRHRRQFHEPRLSRILRLVALLREIGDGYGVSPGVVAVAWTLSNPAITGAITGLRSVKEVNEIAPALNFKLNADEYARITKRVTSIGWHLSLLYSWTQPRSRRAVRRRKPLSGTSQA